MNGDLARHFDHTLLRAEMNQDQVRQLCGEALQHHMAAVCVFPFFVPLAKRTLGSSPVRIATVIAFPFGATFTSVKAAELRAAAAAGADEADFVINIAALKSGNDTAVESEMQELTAASRSLGVVSKFILETAYLAHDEKLRLCRMANRIRPDFVKTSTGYAPAGATVEDVRLLRDNLLPEIQIKAAGGIRTRKQATALLQAGASRIGTSSAVQILKEKG